jgi:hypothetical protein
MIENRSRLEKQILLGRQAVRKTLRTPAPAISVKPPTDGDLMAGARSSLAPTPGQADGEMPMSMDTDAEKEFARGAEYFFRRRSRTASPHPDIPSLEEQTMRTDLARNQFRRRKLASGLFESPARDGRPTLRSATPDPPPDAVVTSPRPEPSTPPSPSTFFNRLRNGSFQNFSSPFSSMRRVAAEAEVREGKRATPTPSTWSSDSSSDYEAYEELREHSNSPPLQLLADERMTRTPEPVSTRELDDEPDVDDSS